MPILQKKSLLRQISRDCIVKARSYRTRHTNDDLIDFLEDINNRIALIEDTAIII